MLIHKFSAVWCNHSSIQGGIVFARNRSTSDMQTLHCRVKQFVSIICWLHLVYKYFRLGFNITKSLFQKVTSVKSQLISRQCYLLFERRPQKRSSLISFCCGKGLSRKQPHCSCCGKSLLDLFYKFKLYNFSSQCLKYAMDEAGNTRGLKTDKQHIDVIRRYSVIYRNQNCYRSLNDIKLKTILQDSSGELFSNLAKV